MAIASSRNNGTGLPVSDCSKELLSDDATYGVVVKRGEGDYTMVPSTSIIR